MRPHGCSSTNHDELKEEVPGARSYGAALGLEACGVSSLGGESQMKGHVAGHGPYMGSRRGLVNRHSCLGVSTLRNNRRGCLFHFVQSKRRVRIGRARAHLGCNPYRFYQFLARNTLA